MNTYVCVICASFVHDHSYCLFLLFIIVYRCSSLFVFCHFEYILS